MASVTQVVQSSGASSSAQGSSSTAPVLEFTCLFTHDLRRKHKRWQDGRLKFHTFNKRIMVYDERGNTIGDTHWREDHDFGEGEEVDLERGGVFVQTGECVGSRDQDLSELVDKRVQEKVQRQSAAAARHSRHAPSGGQAVALPRASTPGIQLRHAHLHTVIGNPTGHHGRALVPTESPFQGRQKLNVQQDESPRPAKRRKREASPPSKSGYAQSLFGTTLTLSGRPMSSNPVQYQPRRTTQVRRDYDAPISCSDLSNQDNNDSDVRQVTSPAKITSHIRHVPLSERSSTTTNTAQPPTETLIGKKAMSKAGVASLLHQTSTREDNKAADTCQSQVSGASKAEQCTNTEPESRTAVREEAVAGSEQQRCGLADAYDDIRQIPKDRPPSINSKARDAAEACMNLVVDNARPNSHSQKPPNKSANSDIHRQLRPTSNEPDEPQDKPALPGLRIELRVKQTKKRGLLMVSEKAQKKKTRKSIIGVVKTAGTNVVSSQAAASGLELGRPVGDGQLGSIPNSKSQRREGQKPTANNEPAAKDPDKPSQARVLPGSDKSVVNSRSTPKHAQKATKSKAVKLGGRQKHSDTELVIHSEGAPTNQDPRPRYVTTTYGAEAPEDQHYSSPADPYEKTMSRYQLQEQVSRQIKLPALPATSTVRMDIQVGIEAEKRRETVPNNREQAPEALDTYTTGERRDGQVERHRDLNRKLRGKVAPPRLAQLPRKSIRSKEVIGWVYEDNEPLVPMRDLTKQNKMSESPQKTQTVATPIIPDTMRIQLGHEAIPLPSKGLGGPRPQSLANSPEHTPERDVEVELSRLNGPSVLLDEQDRPASASHTTLANKCRDATATASNGKDVAGAHPLTTNSRIQNPLAKLIESARARGEPHHELLDPAAKDPVDQAIDLLDTPSIEEKQVATQLTSMERRVSVASVELLDSAVPRHKPTRGVSIPVSRNEVDLVTSVNQTQVARIEPGRRIDHKPIEQSGSASRQAGLVSENPIETGEARPDALIDVSEGMVRPKERMPRLVNPATRGRKAAQPTDAAGKVPECILPPSDGAAGVANKSIRPVVHIPDKAAKEPLPLPGFARANGGAWSREAYDLFEYAKPSQVA